MPSLFGWGFGVTGSDCQYLCSVVKIDFGLAAAKLRETKQNICFFLLYFLLDRLLWLRIDWPLGFFHGRQLQLIGSVDISCSHGDGQLNMYVYTKSIC